MADHPLRPATHRRLGRPLPYQQANGTQAHPLAPEDFGLATSSGISPGFPELCQTKGQITYALLTRAPLYSLPEGNFLARLACVKHAASVRPEPGSNSPLEKIKFNPRKDPDPDLII